MGRRLLITAAAFAMVLGVSTQAWAQKKYELRFGWTGNVGQSVHQDEGFFGLTRPVHNFGGWDIHVGGEVRFGYEYDWGGIQKYLGVVRFSKDDTVMKWPTFIDFHGGVEHFEGDTVGFIEPSAGLLLPWEIGRLRAFGQVGMPVHFYSGNAEVGFSGKFGFRF